MEKEEQKKPDYYRRFLWLALIIVLFLSGIIRIGFNESPSLANSNKPELFSKSWHEVLERTDEYLLVRVWGQYENHTNYDYYHTITIEFKPHFGQEKTLSSKEFIVRKHTAITKSADFRIEGDFSRGGFGIMSGERSVRID